MKILVKGSLGASTDEFTVIIEFDNAFSIREFWQAVRDFLTEVGFERPIEQMHIEVLGSPIYCNESPDRSLLDLLQTLGYIPSDDPAIVYVQLDDSEPLLRRDQSYLSQQAAYQAIRDYLPDHVMASFVKKLPQWLRGIDDQFKAVLGAYTRQKLYVEPASGGQFRVYNWVNRESEIYELDDIMLIKAKTYQMGCVINYLWQIGQPVTDPHVIDALLWIWNRRGDFRMDFDVDFYPPSLYVPCLEHTMKMIIAVFLEGDRDITEEAIMAALFDSGVARGAKKALVDAALAVDAVEYAAQLQQEIRGHYDFCIALMRSHGTITGHIDNALFDQKVLRLIHDIEQRELSLQEGGESVIGLFGNVITQLDKLGDLYNLMQYIGIGQSDKAGDHEKLCQLRYRRKNFHFNSWGYRETNDSEAIAELIYGRVTVLMEAKVFRLSEVDRQQCRDIFSLKCRRFGKNKLPRWWDDGEYHEAIFDLERPEHDFVQMAF